MNMGHSVDAALDMCIAGVACNGQAENRQYGGFPVLSNCYIAQAASIRAINRCPVNRARGSALAASAA